MVCSPGESIEYMNRQREQESIDQVGGGLRVVTRLPLTRILYLSDEILSMSSFVQRVQRSLYRVGSTCRPIGVAN